MFASEVSLYIDLEIFVVENVNHKVKYQYIYFTTDNHCSQHIFGRMVSQHI